MFTLSLPGGTALLHDSAYKLPEAQRTEFSYYNLVDSAIGSTINDIDRHFEPLLLLVNANQEEAKLNAINNLRYLLFDIVGKQVAPNILALCCLVHSVNDQPWDDYSPEGVEELARKLSDLGICQQHADCIKPLYEKILKPLKRQFPQHFPDTQQEADERLQRALMLTLDEIVQPDDISLEVRKRGIEREFIDSIKPQLMAGTNNVLDSIREAYRKNKFLLLTECLPVDDSTPAFTFWAYIADLQDKYRRQTKN